MVKVSFGRPCHVPPCLINEEGGSNQLPPLCLEQTHFAIIEPQTNEMLIQSPRFNFQR